MLSRAQRSAKKKPGTWAFQASRRKHKTGRYADKNQLGKGAKRHKKVLPQISVVPQGQARKVEDKKAHQGCQEKRLQALGGHPPEGQNLAQGQPTPGCPLLPALESCPDPGL